MFTNIRSNKRIAIGNVIRLLHEAEYNLINPLPTYHLIKENERNILSRSFSPIFFPGYRHSFSSPFAPSHTLRKMRYSLMKMRF
jgi:hypothetical protein